MLMRGLPTEVPETGFSTVQFLTKVTRPFTACSSFSPPLLLPSAFIAHLFPPYASASVASVDEGPPNQVLEGVSSNVPFLEYNRPGFHVFFPVDTKSTCRSKQHLSETQQRPPVLFQKALPQHSLLVHHYIVTNSSGFA